MNELRITGKSDLAQPVSSPARKVMSALTGEIYNYQELNDQLAGYEFSPRTDRDSETLNASYLRWGADCFERFHGIFGAAILDGESRRLVLARDRFGQVPLFFRIVNGLLHFATESNRLVSFGGIDLDRDELLKLLAFGFSFDHLVKGIRRVRPGTLLIADSKGVREQTFWKPIFAVNYRIGTEEATELALEALSKGIDQLTPRDVEFGCFVSGGVDSAIVATLLARGRAGLPLYTSGLVGAHLFEGPAPVDPDYAPVEGTGNEFQFADDLADSTEVQYRRREYEVEELIENLPRMVSLLPGGPVMSTSFPAFYFAASASGADQIRVCFTGEGADELNGGYRTCDMDQYAGGKFCEPFIAASNFFSGDEIARLLGDESRRRLQEICHLIDSEVLSSFEGDGEHEDVLWNQVRSFMIGMVFCPHLLEKGNGMSMGRGPTELRMPYLSNDYVALSLEMPHSVFQMNSIRKALQSRIALRVGLPTSVLKRPKQRTSLPYYGLFFSDERFAVFGRRILSRSAHISDLLCLRDPWKYVEALRGYRDAHKKAWSLLILELWLRAHVR